MDEYTNEQLIDLQRALHADMKAIKAKKRAVDAELQRRSIVQSAARKLDQMSPAERAVAGQLIGQAGGVPSGESVGTPGAR